MIQIYHNPRCGKSRNCLAFIENTKQDFEIIPYLTDTPSFDALTELLQKLNLKPIELVRTKEKIWTDNFKNKTMTDAEIIQAMVDNPILIERPIVVKDGKAIIGRDLEQVRPFLETL
ncbi:arsenate reductase (glutaredoxin) [Flavobacterium sp. LS1R47]|uniref:Arsenate reductase (Glutaredoxin) n=1 Tax=Flavobacterium frigoritolerans TaxID=2987686 RepID=A0A9X2ZM02_9FLAO|nr:arsenate reductase (glutaredoxin) [Flavobacterium frigoritolerans]MCV9933474.1 arsenate reductase (glutaredoxin) [Flavobacterium frigoritolerans]